ncbi:MAG: GtrA family protein [Bacteroidaceae bacterium]|nr:GtrA family protein [Bacteroidaceae bacterium]
MNLRLIRQFLRAQTSSLICTGIDFAVTAALVKFAGLWYVIANIIGAVCGGAENCIINYNWAFKGTSQRKQTIFYRYVLVWFGSIFLNTAGTTLVANIMSHDGTPKAFGIVMEAKTLVAILVAIFWNFLMQKKYVYKK